MAYRSEGYTGPLTGGEILHFADDDDLVPAGLYAAALAEFRRFPNIGLVFGSIEADPPVL